MIRLTRLQPCALLAVAVLTAGCEARLSVDLSTSAAAETKAVSLKISAVQLLDADGDSTRLGLTSSARSPVDLLDYADGGLLPLSDESGDADTEYTGLRALFDLDDAYVELDDGSRIDLVLDEAADYADIDLKMSEGDTAQLILSMDLRFSLSDRRNDLGVFQLRPALRATRADEAAGVSGTVATSLLTASSCRQGRDVAEGVAVYVYAGANRTPADYYADGGVVSVNQPLTSAPVRYDATRAAYTYTAYYLSPGSYTLALTCEADDEDPAANDDLSFHTAHHATLTAGAELTLDITD